jgi:hypothetical protein
MTVMMISNYEGKRSAYRIGSDVTELSEQAFTADYNNRPSQWIITIGLHSGL